MSETEPGGQPRRTWGVEERAWKQDLPDLPDDVIDLLAEPIIVDASLHQSASGDGDPFTQALDSLVEQIDVELAADQSPPALGRQAVGNTVEVSRIQPDQLTGDLL